MKAKKLSLNLASNPLRNKRLFNLLFCTGVLIILIVSYFAGNIFFTYKVKKRDLKAKVTDIEQKMITAQRKEREYTTKVEAESKGYMGTVDLINGIILRKSFSWLNFLANLENSLPNSSYIVSLAPRIMNDSSMEVKFRVVSQNLQDLLKLINNLIALKFKPRVEGESRDQRGLIISDISLRYDRNV